MRYCSSHRMRNFGERIDGVLAVAWLKDLGAPYLPGAAKERGRGPCQKAQFRVEVGTKPSCTSGDAALLMLGWKFASAFTAC